MKFNDFIDSKLAQTNYLILNEKDHHTIQNTSVYSLVSLSGLLPNPNQTDQTRSYLALGYAITPIALCTGYTHFIYPSLERFETLISHPIRDK